MPSPDRLIISSLDLPWLWLALAYVLGALPFAVWVGRRAGTDPRRSGSKNPGASNVARTAGKGWGLITLCLDALKGALIPSLIMSGYLISEAAPIEGQERLRMGLDLSEWAALAGVFGVLGHVTSPFLGFRGGRGVATALGAMGALHIGLAGLGVFVWVTVLMLSRTPAWSSLALALSFVVFSHSPSVSDAVRLFSICASTIIVVRHWGHLKRLLVG